jgi:hypothetical protein
MLRYSSAFFKDSAIASLKFAQPGTQIFYTVNNNEPTGNDALYQKEIVIKKSPVTLKAKAFGNGFIPSKTVHVTFIKDGLKIKSVEQPPADDKFPGNGVGTLSDDEGGIADLHNKNFLGYMKGPVEINVTLEKKEKITSVLLDFLQDHGSWIFLPQEISIFFYNEKKKAFESMVQEEVPVDSASNENSTVLKMVRSTRKINSDKLKIILEPLQSLPGNHPGKGKPGWLFIDEIKIY